MKRIVVCCLLLCGQLCWGQNTPRSERPIFLYAEFGGGVYSSQTTAQYSIETPRLEVDRQASLIGFWAGQLGVRWLDRHHFGLGFENALLSNEFLYVDQATNPQGFPAATFGYELSFDYYNAFFQYSYDVLVHKRLALRPLVQVGVGVSHMYGQEFPTTRFSSQTANIPIAAGNYAMQGDITQHREVVFTYGAGLSFEWEIVDDYLAIGASLKVTGSPLREVSTYRVFLEYENDPPLEFDTTSGLFGIHLGAFVRGYF